MEIYQIKVTLKDSRPSIWRSVKISSDTTLGMLHHVLQVTMGWADNHPHKYTIGGFNYVVHDQDPKAGKSGEIDVHINQVAVEGDAFLYEYGEEYCWVLKLDIEEVRMDVAELVHPLCLAGERASPPENCRGVAGYKHLLDVLGDPLHVQYESMHAKIRPDYDPNCFDRDEVNWMLKWLK